MRTDQQIMPAGAEPMEAAADPQAADREADRLREVLRGLIDRLMREAEDRVAKRNIIEKRWLEDLRQLHGEYDAKLLGELTAAKRSTLFVNATRPKANACEARLVDMLFPTDDKNWGISPTPVPRLAEAAGAAVEQADKLAGQANMALQQGDPMHQPLIQAAQQQQDAAARLKAEMDEARKRSERMEQEISDQLTECRYHLQMRDVIRDACRIGTGIVKGPVANTDRSRLSWQKVAAEGGAEVYELAWSERPRPAYYRVDPWGFFPDPDARTVEESAEFFERHLMTPKELRSLARQPDFDPDAIRRLLRDGKPSGVAPSYIAELREITGVTSSAGDGRFHVWEYRGCLDQQAMRDICACLGKDELAPGGEAVDPLAEVPVVVWFCQDEILKFGIQHLDSGEPIYSVFNLEKDDSSLWGFGIPYLMRDAQKAINGAWRMMMDNAGLSTGPQIEIDAAIAEPADGNWDITPRKVWRRKATAPAGKPAIITYDIPSNQAELANIIELAMQLVDEETAMSEIAQGEQGSHTTQTAQGMTILMNSVNVMFRRMVKNFDDDVTVPAIRRLYDWNMQFSPREDIKGDMEIDARGSSVLLVREMQAQNLMALANMTAHPTLGPLLKAAPILRQLVKSMMIAADEAVLTDEEIKQKAEQEAQQEGQGQTDPRAEIEMRKIEADQQRAKLDAETKLQVAQISRDTELAKLAADQNMTVEQMRAKLQMQAVDTEHKERLFAAEVGFKDRQSQREAENPQLAAPAAGTRFAP